MEGEGEGGRWGKWKKRITRVFVGGKSGKESRGSVEELPRIVVSWKLQTLEFFFGPSVTGEQPRGGGSGEEGE